MIFHKKNIVLFASSTKTNRTATAPQTLLYMLNLIRETPNPIPYLEGEWDLASRLIVGISRVSMLLIRVIGMATKPLTLNPKP